MTSFWNWLTWLGLGVLWRNVSNVNCFRWLVRYHSHVKLLNREGSFFGNLLTCLQRSQNYITISISPILSALIWKCGLSFCNLGTVAHPSFHHLFLLTLLIFTDASFLGFGAYFDNLWFSDVWPKSVQAGITSRETNIAFLELLSILVAISIWLVILRHRQIVVFTDNEEIISICSSGSSKDPNLMALVRVLSFFLLSLVVILLFLMFQENGAYLLTFYLGYRCRNSS